MSRLILAYAEFLACPKATRWDTADEGFLIFTTIFGDLRSKKDLEPTYPMSVIHEATPTTSGLGLKPLSRRDPSAPLEKSFLCGFCLTHPLA